MLSASDIILKYVCPGLGVVVATFMFAAPLRDCYVAVKAGKGLGPLNPTPWAFCTGNCVGVSFLTVYCAAVFYAWFPDISVKISLHSG